MMATGDLLVPASIMPEACCPDSPLWLHRLLQAEQLHHQTIEMTLVFIAQTFFGTLKSTGCILHVIRSTASLCESGTKGAFFRL